jgi:transcriptional regulator with XRE-family HTH domain
MSAPHDRIRAYRERAGMSLDELADEIAKVCGDRPSKAKMSRIETGIQPVPVDLLPALKKITGIPGEELRPDLAAALRGGR